MRGYYESDSNDRYTFQSGRQMRGLPCSDCGSSWGHFGFCPLFSDVSMEQILGLPDVDKHLKPMRKGEKPQSDSQSFYRKAQEKRLRVEASKKAQVLPEDYDPVYTEGDRIIAHALGVLL